MFEMRARDSSVTNHDCVLPKWAIPALVIGVAVAYIRVLGADFISFDDRLYIVDNPMVRNGLSREGLLWAFSLDFKDGTYWHPLTWLVHMLECEIFGLRPMWFHLVGAIVHGVNSILVLLVMHRLTDRFRAAFVTAVLFAFHPINVESVAWIAELKNQLSTCLFLLTLIAYIAYARRPSWPRWLVVTLVLGLGLLTKPFIATTGCLLLVLDFWPLKRWQSTTGSFRSNLRLVGEKLPWILLGTLVTRLGMLPLRYANCVIGFDEVPLVLRLVNAPISLVQTLIHLVAPTRLSIFVPFPTVIPSWRLFAALAVLASITGAALWAWRRAPYLLAGWLWFLGTSVPVLGIIQAGVWPALADRWAYVPGLGIFMIAGMAADALAGRMRLGVAKALAFATVTALIVGTILQVGHWQNTHTLFSHALTIDPDNHLALEVLGNDASERGDFDEALRLLGASLRIKPGVRSAQHGLAASLASAGRIVEADAMMLRILDEGRDVQGLANYGNLCSTTGRPDKAIALFREALSIDDDNTAVLNGLGVALIRSGRLQAAEEVLMTAAQIDPESSAAANLERLRHGVHDIN